MFLSFHHLAKQWEFVWEVHPNEKKDKTHKHKQAETSIIQATQENMKPEQREQSSQSLSAAGGAAH